MTFFQLITAAIADITKYGYDSPERLKRWLAEITKSLKKTMVPTHYLEETLRKSFSSTYQRTLKGDKLLKINKDVPAFTLASVKPKLHAELQRRIMASAQLIKDNREEMINKTLQRFSGWATSVPPGGTKVADKNEVKEKLGKSLKSLPFEERRVMIDQGHKFVASLKDIVAVDKGAIAAEWCSHYRQPGYDYREEHKLRDGKVFAIRGNQVMEMGLMNKGAGYTDEITAPGEEVMCRCSYRYIFSLSKLPPDMLTRKGKDKLDEAKNIRSKM